MKFEVRAVAEITQLEIICKERRGYYNRRQQPARVLHPYGITGRRSYLRRKNDVCLLGTDHFEKPVWLAALAIIVLSVFDFMLTTHILDSGGSELNILMGYASEQGDIFFFMTKYSLTVLAVLILLANQHHHFLRAVRVKSILYTIAAGYLSLFVYEVNLISNI